MKHDNIVDYVRNSDWNCQGHIPNKNPAAIVIIQNNGVGGSNNGRNFIPVTVTANKLNLLLNITFVIRININIEEAVNEV